jgi:hypothetical protein|tara:strand:- start:20 stop:262 length:243 start_codon:yes stop_codon:yes gene_type:complete
VEKTDQRFLEDRIGMTETDGWLDFKEDLKNLEKSIVNFDSIGSEKDLWFIKGQLRVINFVLSLEDTTSLALEELLDGNPT